MRFKTLLESIVIECVQGILYFYCCCENFQNELSQTTAWKGSAYVTCDKDWRKHDPITLIRSNSGRQWRKKI